MCKYNCNMAFISLQFNTDQIKTQFQNLGAACDASFSAAADSTNIKINAEKERLTGTITKINSEIDDLKKQQETLHTKIDEFNEKHSPEFKHLDELLKKYDSLKTKFNSAKNNFDQWGEPSISPEENEKATQDFDDLFKELGDLEYEISEQEKIVNSLNEDLNTAQKNLKNVSDNLDKKESEKKDHNNELTKIIDENPDRVFHPFPNSLADLIKYDTALSSFSSIKQFINALPCITIRSYFITTAMMEVLTNLINAANAGYKHGQEIAENFNELKEKGDKFKTTFKALASSSGLRLFFDKLVKNVPNLVSGNETSARLYRLCEMLYYRLATTKHNNTFYLPCEIESGFFDSTSEGWGNQSYLSLGAGKGGFFEILKQTNGLDVMPTFNVVKVNSNTERLDISLDLINDTREAAISNTILVRTLIICTKWVQCGVIQLPGNLYDVSIPGTGQRWFMCTAEITVTNKGALRLMENVTKDELKGLSSSELKEFRIPDAYSLNISFNSLIPNNLNNFLLAKVANGQIFMNKGTVLHTLASNLGDALDMVNSAADKASAAAESDISGIDNIDELDQLKSDITNDINKANPDSLAKIAYNNAYNAACLSILGDDTDESTMDDAAEMAGTIAKERVLAAIENRRAALVKEKEEAAKKNQQQSEQPLPVN